MYCILRPPSLWKNCNERGPHFLFWNDFSLGPVQPYHSPRAIIAFLSSILVFLLSVLQVNVYLDPAYPSWQERGVSPIGQQQKIVRASSYMLPLQERVIELFAAMTLSDSSLEWAEYIKPKMKRQHLFAILINYYSMALRETYRMIPNSIHLCSHWSIPLIGDFHENRRGAPKCSVRLFFLILLLNQHIFIYYWRTEWSPVVPMQNSNI